MDGLIIVDKDKGMLSFPVVQRIRALSGEKKVGHTGTLDPQATGLLILCLGRATQFVEMLMNGDKVYEGEFTFGVRTDSLDGDGKVISSVDTNIQESDVRDLIPQFTGTIMQVPPMVSAVRHKGKRLYDLAREGKTVEREAKKVTIHAMELTRWTPGPQPRAEFRVTCSRGTYIRKLAEDMGDILGCGAYLSALRRTRSGSFTIAEARTLDELEKMHAEGRFGESVISLPEAARRIHKDTFSPTIKGT